jgi:pimeloyl-ACP methyl ester carboxylesterase
MRRSEIRRALAAGALLACWLAASVAGTAPASTQERLLAEKASRDSGGASGSSSSRKRAIVSRAISFAVRNTNTSALTCPSDGAPYEVKGHLVAPRSAVSRPKARKRGVTLYLHGRGFGEFLWNFTSVPSQNYATAQAKAGHASVVIDRLGYGASGHPDGNQTCIGSQADVVHQVVRKLRSGDYSIDAGPSPAFGKVALAGQSTGAQIANVEAYSFRDIDALIVVALSFQTTPRAAQVFGETRAICLAGGEPAFPGGPGGYAFNFGQSEADFKRTMFHRVRGSVAKAVIGLRNRDPCGDTVSLLNALLRQKSALPKIKVPVLVICGEKDALFTPKACRAQKDLYSGSRSASLESVRQAGHAPMLERTASIFRAKIGRWLRKRRF